MAFAPMPWPATSLGVGSECAARSGYGRGGNRRWPGGCFRANLGLRAGDTNPVAARRPRLPVFPPIPAEVGAARIPPLSLRVIEVGIEEVSPFPC